MEKEPVNVFLICCYRSHKRSTKQKVGIDSIAAPMLLWENTRREERRSTKLVALSIWLLLLLSFAFAALIEKSPQELLVINTFSSYLIPLSFLCVYIIERRWVKENFIDIGAVCCLRRAAHYRSAFCLCRHVLLLNEPSLFLSYISFFSQWICIL